MSVECQICYEATNPATQYTAPCGNSFHARCTQAWLHARREDLLGASCPKCRSPWNFTDLDRNNLDVNAACESQDPLAQYLLLKCMYKAVFVAAEKNILYTVETKWGDNPHNPTHKVHYYLYQLTGKEGREALAWEELPIETLQEAIGNALVEHAYYAVEAALTPILKEHGDKDWSFYLKEVYSWILEVTLHHNLDLEFLCNTCEQLLAERGKEFAPQLLEDAVKAFKGSYQNTRLNFLTVSMELLPLFQSIVTLGAPDKESTLQFTDPTVSKLLLWAPKVQGSDSVLTGIFSTLEHACVQAPPFASLFAHAANKQKALDCFTTFGLICDAFARIKAALDVQENKAYLLSSIAALLTYVHQCHAQDKTSIFPHLYPALATLTHTLSNSEEPSPSPSDYPTLCSYMQQMFTHQAQRLIHECAPKLRAKPCSLLAIRFLKAICSCPLRTTDRVSLLTDLDALCINAGAFSPLSMARLFVAEILGRDATISDVGDVRLHLLHATDSILQVMKAEFSGRPDLQLREIAKVVRSGELPNTQEPIPPQINLFVVNYLAKLLPENAPFQEVIKNATDADSGKIRLELLYDALEKFIPQHRCIFQTVFSTQGASTSPGAMVGDPRDTSHNCSIQ